VTELEFVKQPEIFGDFGVVPLNDHLTIIHGDLAVRSSQFEQKSMAQFR
jgi:hypothetical protein